MKTKLLLILSLVANLALSATVVFFSETLARVPDYTPASVMYKIITNAPPLVVENEPKTAQ